MTRLTIAQRNQAIGMLICGTSNRQVAKFFEFKIPQLLDYSTDTSQQELQTTDQGREDLNDYRTDIGEGLLDNT